MADDLSDIPRHVLEEFKKAGVDYTGWQVRTGGLPAPRLGYAMRWLAHLERGEKRARQRYARWMFRLAVATAMLASIAVVEFGCLLAMAAAHRP